MIAQTNGFLLTGAAHHKKLIYVFAVTTVFCHCVGEALFLLFLFCLIHFGAVIVTIVADA